MSSDKIFDLTAGVYFYCYNIDYRLYRLDDVFQNKQDPCQQKLTHTVYYKYQQRSLQIDEY